MDAVKIMYLPVKTITADHHALNHSANENLIEENKAVIISFAKKDEEESIAPFYDELHFANYE